MRDAREVTSLVRIEPYTQSGSAERRSNSLRAIAIGPCVAQKDIVNSRHDGATDCRIDIVYTRILWCQAVSGSLSWSDRKLHSGTAALYYVGQKWVGGDRH